MTNGGAGSNHIVGSTNQQKKYNQDMYTYIFIYRFRSLPRTEALIYTYTTAVGLTGSNQNEALLSHQTSIRWPQSRLHFPACSRSLTGSFKAGPQQEKLRSWAPRPTGRLELPTNYLIMGHFTNLTLKPTWFSCINIFSADSGIILVEAFSPISTDCI